MQVSCRLKKFRTLLEYIRNYNYRCKLHELLKNVDKSHSLELLGLISNEFFDLFDSKDVLELLFDTGYLYDHPEVVKHLISCVSLDEASKIFDEFLQKIIHVDASLASTLILVNQDIALPLEPYASHFASIGSWQTVP